MNDMKYLTIILVTIILVIIAVSQMYVAYPVNNSSNYEIITIEGMTCIEYNNSLTCNWNEWDGEDRMKWEYLIIKVHEDLVKREFAFNSLGDERWILTSVDNDTAYFKRSIRKRQEPTEAGND